MPAFDGLGKALRWIRDKQAKKQYQVAESAGVTKAMLSAYETGKQKPSLETLEKILGALRVDLSDLFNALQIVNERPVAGRYFEGSAADTASRGGASLAEAGGIDLQQILGTRRSIHPAEQEALLEMLRGFHKLLRYLHHAGARIDGDLLGLGSPPESGPDSG